MTSGTPSPYSPTICPTDFSCPEDNGCSTTGGSPARWLKLQCGVEYSEGSYADAGSSTPITIEACSQKCLQDTNCAAVTFVGNKKAGNCYLKTGRGTVTNSFNDGKWTNSLFKWKFANQQQGLYLTDAPSGQSGSNPPPSQTNPNTPATTPLKCTTDGSQPNDDGKTFVANGKTFLVRCNIDSSGATIRGIQQTAGDLNSCITSCASEATCVSVVLVGTECYLKSDIGVTRTGTGAYYAELVPASSTCNVPGKVTSGITYTDIRGLTLADCKAQCQSYSLAGLQCAVFAQNPTTQLCTLSLGSTAPTFEDAFEPSQSSGQFWTDDPDSTQYWYAGDCVVDEPVASVN